MHDTENELERLSAHLEERQTRRRACQSYAKRVTKNLARDDDTMLHAEFVAAVCNEFDTDYGLGIQLCLEWALDCYMGIEFKRAYPWLRQIWEHLVEGGHDIRNKLDYFNDCEAFFVDAERLILVFGKHYRNSPRYLVIDEPKHILDWHRCYVRRIWRRTKLDCIGGVEHPTLRHYRDVGFSMGFSDGPLRIYGDARDRGHVLTFRDEFGPAQCDKVIWNINNPLGFFFEINTLWTQTVGVRNAEAAKAHRNTTRSDDD